MSDFRIDIPFEKRPPRLKDLVNKHVMDSVWVRDTPFGPVTDSLKIAEKFDINHKHILRSIDKCQQELSTEPKFGLCKNLIENSYLSGQTGRQRVYRKVDITEFRFSVITAFSGDIVSIFHNETYLAGLNQRQVDAIKGHYRKKMK